ncbi:MAG: hypothetical protein KDJ78_07000 [Rhodobacteraceae bacterium]|nr:hypothetical protein [Paracoccaceae bacterium]
MFKIDVGLSPSRTMGPMLAARPAETGAAGAIPVRMLVS